MPRRKNKPRRSREDENTGTKRKAISPLDAAISQDTTQNTGLTSSSTQCKDNNSVNSNKRLHISSPEYFTFNEHCATNTALRGGMAYQQSSYPQYMQSPPTYVQPAPAQAATPMSNNIIPPWASVIMDEMKDIKSILNRIEPMEKTINVINSRFAELEIKVNDIDKRVIEVEKSCGAMNKMFESKSEDIIRAKTEISNLKKTCKEYESNVETMSETMKTLNERLTDSETRSMKNNLIFFGIEEQADENCENHIRHFIQEKLKIDSQNMLIDRAHRLGNDRHAKKPRPIVVRFNYFKDREVVREKSFQMNDTLKRDHYGVSIQRPRHVREARNALYHVMKQEQQKGKQARFVGDKLYINGELYKPQQ